MTFDHEVYLYKPVSGTLIRKLAHRHSQSRYTLKEPADSLEGWLGTQAETTGWLERKGVPYIIVQLIEPEKL